MRLFVAIPLADSVKQHLAAARTPREGIRWQNPKQYHITLKFLGQTESAVVDGVQIALSTIQAAPFSLQINRVGAFPDRETPRILWAGVEPAPALMELQQKVERTCVEAGLAPEDRPFLPHITMGRLQKDAPSGVARPFFNQVLSFDVIQSRVTDFALYESRLSPEGATHHKVANFQLTGC